MINFQDLQDDHRKVLKVINGAIKSCINVHGPITASLISSASKRIIGALKTYDAGKTKVES